MIRGSRNERTDLSFRGKDGNLEESLCLPLWARLVFVTGKGQAFMSVSMCGEEKVRSNSKQVLFFRPFLGVGLCGQRGETGTGQEANTSCSVSEVSSS